jgi:hypothetical protein
MDRFVAVAIVAPVLVLGCTSTAGPAAPGPGCSPDSTVTGCRGSAGFSCSSDVSPEQIDSSLVCSDGVGGGGGLTLYCCVQFQSSSCAPDPTVQNCPGTSIGFSCTGSDTPEDADPTLICGPGAVGNAGSLLYCCTA